RAPVRREPRAAFSEVLPQRRVTPRVDLRLRVADPEDRTFLAEGHPDVLDHRARLRARAVVAHLSLRAEEALVGRLVVGVAHERGGGLPRVDPAARPPAACGIEFLPVVAPREALVLLRLDLLPGHLDLDCAELEAPVRARASHRRAALEVGLTRH